MTQTVKFITISLIVFFLTTTLSFSKDQTGGRYMGRTLVAYDGSEHSDKALEKLTGFVNVKIK